MLSFLSPICPVIYPSFSPIKLSVTHHLCNLFTFAFYFGEGNGTPLQYSCLENPMDGGAWWAAVHGVAKSWTRLSDFPFIFHFHALEKEMATHSSVLAWRIPGTGKPGGLPSMGLHRVGHDWSDLAAAAFYLAISITYDPCPWLTFKLPGEEHTAYVLIVLYSTQHGTL